MTAAVFSPQLSQPLSSPMSGNPEWGFLPAHALQFQSVDTHVSTRRQQAYPQLVLNTHRTHQALDYLDFSAHSDAPIYSQQHDGAVRPHFDAGSRSAITPSHHWNQELRRHERSASQQSIDVDSMDEDEDDENEPSSNVAGRASGRASMSAASIAKRKMKRFRLSHTQTRFLMDEFIKQPHPDAAQREYLSREIPGLSPRQVQVWFQNRRAKLKRLLVDDRERTLKSKTHSLEKCGLPSPETPTYPLSNKAQSVTSEDGQNIMHEKPEEFMETIQRSISNIEPRTYDNVPSIAHSLASSRPASIGSDTRFEHHARRREGGAFTLKHGQHVRASLQHHRQRKLRKQTTLIFGREVELLVQDSSDSCDEDPEDDDDDDALESPALSQHSLEMQDEPLLSPAVHAGPRFAEQDLFHIYEQAVARGNIMTQRSPETLVSTDRRPSVMRHQTYHPDAGAPTLQRRPCYASRPSWPAYTETAAYDPQRIAPSLASAWMRVQQGSP